MNLTVGFNGTQFVIDTNKQVVPAISEWLGWKRMPYGSYVAPCYPSSVLGIKQSPAVTLSWAMDAAKVRDSLLAKLQRARDALSGAQHTVLLPTSRSPRKHQSQAVLAMEHMGNRVLLADDMGLGKTSSVLWAVHEAKASHLLVVCPVSVKFNWQNEIMETLGDGWRTVVINGSAKKRADQFVEAGLHAKSPTATGLAVIINYDLLIHITDAQRAWLIEFSKGAFVVFDESHYLKNRTAKRLHECSPMAAQAQFVCCLTGTPMRNMADDLFTQVELVRPGTWTSYRDFAKRYLVIQSVKFGKRDVQKIVGTKNLTELNAVMNTLQIRRAKSEAIDLPPKVYTYPELELEGPLLKLYKAMKEFAKIELSKLATATQVDANGVGPITIFDPRAKSAVEQALRCEQIAQGFIGGIPDPVMAKVGPEILKHAERIPGRPNELIFPEAPKLLWLLEAIESVIAQGGAPMIGTRFNAPIDWLLKALFDRGIDAGILHGGRGAHERAVTLEAFQQKMIHALIVQVKIAEGWNATRCQDVLCFGRDWSPAINMQFEDRAHRMGQTGTVNVQIPIVRKTIEVMIDRRLRAKGADANQALKTVTIEELMEAL
jgi:SNF2 family DNA or RNA helicase